jgi:hypothetical protein
MYRSGRIGAFPREKWELLASEHCRLPAIPHADRRACTVARDTKAFSRAVWASSAARRSCPSTIVVSPVSMRYLDQPIELVTVFE